MTAAVPVPQGDRSTSPSGEDGHAAKIGALATAAAP